MSIGLEALLANRTEIDAELRKNKSPVTMMFTDLAGSTSFFDQFGDTAGVKWIEEHNTIVFPQVEKHGGTVVKTIGDSVMAYFPNPVKAVQAGSDILRALHAANAPRDPKDKMYVRVALHHGLGYLRGGDVFGDVVNVAARIAKTCLPAQVLVSEAVYLGANESAGMEFRPVGAVQFRGKTTAEQLYEVMWIDEDSYTELRKIFPAKKQDEKQEDFTGGRYVIQSELGRGAMGVVYKAYDRLIGRHVALKTIPLEVEESERHALVERLKKEAQTAGALDHPNIVTVFDVGDEAGVFYFTMQHVEGKPLTSIRESKELLPLPQLFDIAEQMLSAMAFAHQAGVIHRDLKPSNMMLTPKGVLKIMDFGIAKFGDSGLTKAGVVLGTPSYLAPEQAAGRRVDQRADIFSLGAILYELFTSEKAFPGESTTSIIYKVMNDEPIPPRAIEPSLSLALDSIIRKALTKDPALRYQTCEELLEAVRESRKNPGMAAVNIPALDKTVAVPEPRTATATTAAQPTVQFLHHPPPAKSHTGLIAAGIVAVAVLGAGYMVWQSRQAGPPPNTQMVTPASAAPATTTAAPATTLAEPVTTVPKTDTSPQNPTASPNTTEPNQPRGALREKMRETVKARIQERRETAPTASGSSMWSRDDIPALMQKADSYSGRGEYRRAILTYEEILRIDSSNRQARDGIAKAREAQGLRR